MNQYSECPLYWLNHKLKLTLLLSILFYLQCAELSFMEDVVENSQVRKAFDLKFNLSSGSLYVKLLKNIKYTFLEKKKEKEGIKEEKLNLSKNEKNMNKACAFRTLGFIIFPFWLCIG